MKSTKFNAATGTDTEGFSRSSNRFGGNQSGLSAVSNAGRGPTKGNDGACHDPVSGAGSAKGAPSHVHDTHAPGAYGKAQYRGVGGTAMPKTGKTTFNSGRGPTKGNQQ